MALLKTFFKNHVSENSAQNPIIGIAKQINKLLRPDYQSDANNQHAAKLFEKVPDHERSKFVTLLDSGVKTRLWMGLATPQLKDEFSHLVISRNIDVWGVKINSELRDQEIVGEIIQTMLHNLEIRQKISAAKPHFIIYYNGFSVKDIPESQGYSSEVGGVSFKDKPLAIAKMEKNIEASISLHSKWPGVEKNITGIFHIECSLEIIIHEFAHLLGDFGFTQEQRERMEALHKQQPFNQDGWRESFAYAVEYFFCCQSVEEWDTREYLRQKFPNYYEFFINIFGENAPKFPWSGTWQQFHST